MSTSNSFGWGEHDSKGSKRRVSKSSERMFTKQRMQSLLTNDGRPWTYEQLDILLNTYLEYGYDKTGDGRRCIEACGRSRDSIGTALRKLAIRYNEFCSYEPTAMRADRTSQPFNSSDYSLLELSTGPSGVKNKAADPAWLSKLLGREEGEVVDHLLELCRRDFRPSFSQPSQREKSWPEVVNTVHQLLKKTKDKRSLCSGSETGS